VSENVLKTLKTLPLYGIISTSASCRHCLVPKSLHVELSYYFWPAKLFSFFTRMHAAFG
jgi:hypothetical protein